MALALGKRKRRQDVSRKNQKGSTDDGSDDDATARALFQRAFEKKFKPLEKTEKPAVQDESEREDDDDDSGSDDSDDDSKESGSENSRDEDDDDWSGISDEEPTTSKPQIEVIEDRTFRKPPTAEEKRLKKQFMTAKIPSTPQYPIPHKPSAASAAAAAKASTDPDAAAADGTDNLQNDLALQRLLKESHLLDANTFAAGGSGSSAPEGAARLRALDMRIRDLGGKKSHLDQERMPIAFRKGMVAKAGQREDKRRTEAKENGIILERFGAKSAGGSGAATRGGARERKKEIGVGGPDVGTYRGATLRLSKNDIKGIEGSKRGGRGGRGGGRGGKRKGPTKFGSGF